MAWQGASIRDNGHAGSILLKIGIAHIGTVWDTRAYRMRLGSCPAHMEAKLDYKHRGWNCDIHADSKSNIKWV